jgi:hypothetical protein
MKVSLIHLRATQTVMADLHLRRKVRPRFILIQEGRASAFPTLKAREDYSLIRVSEVGELA